MHLFLFDLMSGLGASLVFLIIALVIGLVTKSPISFGVCLLITTVSVIVFVLIIQSPETRLYGGIIDAIGSFLLLYLISHRKSNREYAEFPIEKDKDRKN